VEERIHCEEKALLQLLPGNEKRNHDKEEKFFVRNRAFVDRLSQQLGTIMFYHT
jgi:hypothetical protein